MNFYNVDEVYSNLVSVIRRKIIDFLHDDINAELQFYVSGGKKRIFPFDVETGGRHFAFFEYRNTSQAKNILKNHKNCTIVFFIGDFFDEDCEFVHDDNLLLITRSKKFLKNKRIKYMDFEDIELYDIKKSHDSPKSFPKFLFKYRQSLSDDKKSGNHTLDSINKSELYWPKPSQLNDPFECSIGKDSMNTYIAKFLYGLTNPRIYESRLKDITKIVDEISKIYTNNYKNIFHFSYFEYMKSLNRNLKSLDLVVQDAEEYFEGLNSSILDDSVRIMSLTKKHDEILMYSYYSSYHYGKCLKYSIDDIVNGLRKESKINVVYYGKVHYSIHRPNISDIYGLSPFIGYKNAALLIKLMLMFTKYDKWRHEQEYRMVAICDDANPLITHASVDFIYYGVKADIISEQTSIILNINSQQMQLDKKDYKLK